MEGVLFNQKWSEEAEAVLLKLVANIKQKPHNKVLSPKYALVIGVFGTALLCFIVFVMRSFATSGVPYDVELAPLMEWLASLSNVDIVVGSVLFGGIYGIIYISFIRIFGNRLGKFGRFAMLGTLGNLTSKEKAIIDASTRLIKTFQGQIESQKSISIKKANMDLKLLVSATQEYSTEIAVTARNTKKYRELVSCISEMERLYYKLSESIK